MIKILLLLPFLPHRSQGSPAHHTFPTYLQPPHSAPMFLRQQTAGRWYCESIGFTNGRFHFTAGGVNFVPIFTNQGLPITEKEN